MTPPPPSSVAYAPGSPASDAELVRAIAGRDQSALAELYRRHGGAVFGLSRRVLGDAALAEDVTQDVFLRLWNEPDRFDARRGTLRSFLQRQTHSRSVERVRAEEARRRREDRSVQTAPTPTDDLEREVLDAIESDRVRRALGALDPKERQVVLAAYYGGRSYREVATSLGLPEGTVKSRIRAGLAHLAVLLDDEGTGVPR